MKTCCDLGGGVISDTYIKQVRLETAGKRINWVGKVFHRRTGQCVVNSKGSVEINGRDIDEAEEVAHEKAVTELDKKLSKLNDKPFMTFK